MSRSYLEFLRSVDTPTLSNAIELLGVRPRTQGFTSLRTRCLFPELGRMAGYAVTAQVETMTQYEAGGAASFVELYQALDAAPKPGVIVLQEVGSHADYAAHCGEVMATIFTRLGAIGLVSDAAVRDIPEVRALRFHYFARGTVASHAWFRIVRTGVPVSVDGVVIRSGDLLHGDENGLLVVPSGVEQELPVKVEEVRKREQRLMSWVRGQEFRLEELLKRMVE